MRPLVGSMPTIYQAGPLFSQADQAWHRATRDLIEAQTAWRVLWPGDFFTPEMIQGWGTDAARRIMEGCRDAIDRCQLVVALLDGAQVDDGTAWEIGYAHARGIPIIGVRTDFRQAGDVPGAVVNAMIHGSCEAVVGSVEELAGRINMMTKT